MRKEDVKVGMKVVPFQKTHGLHSFEDFKNSTTSSTKFFKENGYLTVYYVYSDGSLGVGFDNENWFFAPEDLNVFVENEINKDGEINKDNKVTNQNDIINTPSKVKIITYQTLPYKINTKFTYNQKESIMTDDGALFNIKIIINGTTTIMIDVDTKEKVVTKLSENDIYNEAKGIDICFHKLFIKKLTKKLNKLIK